MAMNPALHNRLGQRLPPARQGAHVPRSTFNVPPAPLPSPTHSTTSSFISVVFDDDFRKEPRDNYVAVREQLTELFEDWLVLLNESVGFFQLN